jgi:hypothetical protein
VAERIELVARAVGDPRRVLAGTDCGFDTSAGKGRVADDVVWAKLKALAEGTRIASTRLFPARSGPSARARLRNPDLPKSAPQAPPDM